MAELCVMELLDSFLFFVCVFLLSAPQTTAVWNVKTIKMIISVIAADEEIDWNAAARSEKSSYKHSASQVATVSLRGQPFSIKVMALSFFLK